MKRRAVLQVVFVVAWGLALVWHTVAAQTIPPELGQGWLPEFTLTSRQLLQLAEATPPDKFGWRPGPGVRSISEVYMHIATGNLWLLEQAGVKSPEFAKLPKDPEKAVTAKGDVIQWLRTSQDAVKSAYQTADRQKHVEFFGKDAVAEGVFLRLLLHNNEHMGQSIAYARMNGIVPPWSK
ncbi:MAG: damage-inducible protein DinB [Acidobacteria bacterium]|nr:MAG: damage-inducible protein DinB [Acidobacteriota bacterium]